MHYEFLIHKFILTFRFTQEVFIELLTYTKHCSRWKWYNHEQRPKNSSPHNAYILWGKTFLNQIYFFKN